MSCKNCSGPISAKNKSGYCKSCAPRFAKHPDHGERVRRALKRKFAADPEAKERARETARANLFSDKARKARSEAAKRIGLSEIGRRAASTPEARAKAGRTITAKRLAWCPPELRDEYLRLSRRCHYRKEEAKRIILEQHEKNMREFRRSIGAA